jgi:hypothetical protein
VLDQRGQLLRAALGFAGLPRPSYDLPLWALRTWLDSWSGIGHVAVGMARQGYDLQLTRYDERGWRASFYTMKMDHSPTRAAGSAHGCVREGWSCFHLHRTLRQTAWDEVVLARNPDRAQAKDASQIDEDRHFETRVDPCSLCPSRRVRAKLGKHRISAQHELRRLEENLVLGRADLALNDVDREGLAAQQPGHTVPTDSARA